MRVVLEEKYPVLEVPSHIKDVIAKIKCAISVVNNVLTSEKSVNIWSDIYNLKRDCDLATEILDRCLPRVNPIFMNLQMVDQGCQSVTTMSKLVFVKLFLLQVLV